MDKDRLRHYLNDSYHGYSSFLKEVIFPIFGEENFEYKYETEMLDAQREIRHLAEQTGIKSIIYVGEIPIGIDLLLIFDITVSDRVKMERNRVNIQRVIRRLMESFSSAFMIFHYDDDSRWDWRFSYCHKGATDKEMTDNKRYTFLLGPGQSCRTATENFIKLADKHKDIEISDIERAFDIEALSKEFFIKYKEQYEKFVCYITGKKYEKVGNKYVEKIVGLPHPTMYDDFNHDDKLVRDYIKQLLGRITFLHFLQKKGWLGVPEGGQWGEGDTQFMRNLFINSADEQKDDFLDLILEPLFDKGLDTDRSTDGDIFDTHVALEHGSRVRIPYLNGGLFERNSLDEIKSQFPACFFADLLDFFYQYNFTIDENDPNEAQVGVDPEMLGRIFENLLEDNKDKGAFYTPKEIVRYMCRQSLIAYLQTGNNDDKQKESIAHFVETYEVSIIGGEKSKLATEIDEKLKNVKICDPAIGSGAFPMGLLKELFLCRGAIEHFDNAAAIKRHIIQENIYGVDIERGAVDIARLRFWLSLIVDEVSPATLPNLDYKIMQGNSLIESFHGIDLSNIVKSEIVDDFQVRMVFDDESQARALFLKAVKEFYDCTSHEQKQDLREKINTHLKSLLKARCSLKTISDEIDSLEAQNELFFLWHTWFQDVFSETSRQGFDIVIGNPPYGAKYDKKTQEYYMNNYETAKNISGIQKASFDTFTLFIELGFNLLHKNGCFAYIVPISLTSSDSLAGVHRMLMNNCENIHISSYAVRPKPVFENAVVNTSILLFKKTKTPCQHLYSTKMYRRGQGFNLKNLIDNLQFVDVKGLTLFGRIPKIGTEIEKCILQKLLAYKTVNYYLEDKNGQPIYYRTSGGRYFKIVTNYSTGSTKETFILLQESFANCIGCILSSSLSFWFYQIYSNNLDWKSVEIKSFPIPNLTNENIDFLKSLYVRYLKDIETKANIRTTSGKSKYKVSTFKEYKIVRSKSIIDEIDDYICPLYGLTGEETEFIKNYDLEFRLAGE